MAVDAFDFTGRCHESDQGRNAVGDRAIMVLARTLHHFLRPSSVFNNDIQSAPFDDLSGCVD
jgi:hypothetical protein